MAKQEIISLRIRKEEKQILELIAKRKGLTVSELVRRLIRGYLKHKGYLV